MMNKEKIKKISLYILSVIGIIAILSVILLIGKNTFLNFLRYPNIKQHKL